MSSKKATKPINIMSLSVDPEIQERLKKSAKKRNVSVSKLVRDMVEKYLPSTDEDIDVVILKIPNSAKLTETELRNWLSPRCENIVKALALDVAKKPML